MPGSTAETIYGRRGGGWLPDKPTPAATPPKDRTRLKCQTCGRLYPEHTGNVCPSCYQPVEHCDGSCWAGRARMADARAHAGDTRTITVDGIPQRHDPAALNDTDREALRRHPQERRP